MGRGFFVLDRQVRGLKPSATFSRHAVTHARLGGWRALHKETPTVTARQLEAYE